MNLNFSKTKKKFDPKQTNQFIFKKRFPEFIGLLKNLDRRRLPGKLLEDAEGGVALQYIKGPGQNNQTIIGIESLSTIQKKKMDIIPDDSTGLTVVVGVGIGYLPLRILEDKRHIRKLLLVEPSLEVFNAFLSNPAVESILTNPKVEVIVGEPTEELLRKKVYLEVVSEDIHIIRNELCFKWNPELYSRIDAQLFALLNKLSTEGATNRLRGPLMFKNRLSNLPMLATGYSDHQLKDAFKGLPAICVAAGPSLQMVLDDLKSLKERALIIACDSALAPLMDKGISPHFITTLDYQDVNVEKFMPLADEKLNSFIVTTFKCTPLVAQYTRSWGIVWAFQDDATILWFAEALGFKKVLMPNCQSVAHLSLGLALLLGADPIILVGQDLAYTEGSGDHAEGTVFREESPIPEGVEVFYTEGIDGSRYPTDRGMLSLKRVFEDIIKNNSGGRTIINSTAKGAKIEGALHMPLKQVEEEYFKESLNRISLSSLKVPTIMETSEGKRLNQAFSNMLKKIIRAKALLEKSLAITNLVIKRDERGEFKGNRNAKELEQVDRINRELDAMRDLWQAVADAGFEMQVESLKWLDDNKRIRAEQGHDEWMKAELRRIKAVNERRLDLVSLFEEGMRKGLDFLKALKGQRDDPLALFNLYMQYGLYGMALDLLEGDDGLFKKVQSEPALLLKAGRLYAELLQFKKAKAMWEECTSKVPHLEHAVEEERLECAKRWIKAIKERCGGLKPEEGVPYPGHWGTRYPHLLDAWIERIIALDSDLSRIKNELEEAFREYAKEIEWLFENDRVRSAEKIVRSWLRLREWVPDVVAYGARCLAAQGHHQEAQSMLEELTKDPSRLPHTSYSNIARALLESGDFKNGIMFLEEAVRFDKKAAELWVELGDVLLENRAFEQAITAYEKAFLAQPERFQLLKKIAEVYGLMGNEAAMREALAAYEKKAGGLKPPSTEEIEREAKEAFEEGLKFVQNKDYVHAFNQFKRAYELSNNNRDALFNMASTLKLLGKYKESLELWQEYLDRFGEDHPDCFFNMGQCNYFLGERERAFQDFKRAYELRPDYVDAIYNAGIVAGELGKWEESKECLERVLALGKRTKEVLNGLGLALVELGECERGVEFLEEVLRLDEKFIKAYQNLGHAYGKLDMPEKALFFSQKGLELEPGHPYLHYNLANALWALGRVNEAEKHFKSAIEKKPELVPAHWNLAHVLLLNRKIKEGFREYQWRWKRKEAILPDTEVPWWSGEEGSGLKLLVWDEQGLGDTLQFARYLPEVKRRVGHVVFAVKEPLVSLLKGVKGADQVVSKERFYEYVKDCDYHVPLLDLPSIFETDWETIPRKVPYLVPDDALVDEYRGIFAQYKGNVKIGICWQGNPKHTNDKRRSVPPEMFFPLFDLERMTFFSLQKDAELPGDFSPHVVDLSRFLKDFSHTAALMEHLDLIITVDTSVAHLAGAIARPVWVLLPLVPDWRWGISLDFTPWYPTMRLFRQREQDKWDDVFKRLRRALVQG